MLDPIAAADFIALLARVNQELGITVLVAEHRLDLLLPHANRVLLLQEGKAAYSGDVQGFLRRCLSEGSRVDAALPPAARLCSGDEPSIPVTISQGRTLLATTVAEISEKGSSLENCSAKTPSPALGFALLEDRPANERESIPDTGPFAESPDGEAAPLIEARELWFRYGAQEPFVLRGASFAARAGKVHAIVGGNGSGKSTLLFALAGVNKLQRGSVRRVGKLHVAALAQDPRVLFVCDTLRDDLREWSDRFAYDDSDIARVMQRLDLPESLLDSHPFDLAGGELQRAALAKLLLAKPQVLLLDEPSKGLDAQAKSDLVGLLHELAQEGSAVVLVSHDLDFVAEAADTVSMIFDGVVDTTGSVRDFFVGNLFYTCAVGRLSQGIIEPCVTFEQLRERLEAVR
ncbi:MAG: ATP-binding cassette domain-containing protein, partial [Coriobacteriales bacterium]|nr:ATP-binding cassette domain-containing protein [Coriobacteriales bacterium]